MKRLKTGQLANFLSQSLPLASASFDDEQGCPLVANGLAAENANEHEEGCCIHKPSQAGDNLVKDTSTPSRPLRLPSRRPHVPNWVGP